MATSAALIQHIAKFPEGLTFTEIQRFIVESNGLDYDKQQVINSWDVNNGAEPRYRRQYRGYWCDRLCTKFFGGPGFLAQYCNKNGNRYTLKAGV